MSAKISALPTRVTVLEEDLLVLANAASGLNYKVSVGDLRVALGDISMSDLTVLIDEVSSTVTYIGKAVPGTLLSSPDWQIQRITSVDPDLSVEWAGSANFTQIWNNRAGLSYS